MLLTTSSVLEPWFKRGKPPKNKIAGGKKWKKTLRRSHRRGIPLSELNNKITEYTGFIYRISDTCRLYEIYVRIADPGGRLSRLRCPKYIRQPKTNFLEVILQLKIISDGFTNSRWNPIHKDELVIVHLQAAYYSLLYHHINSRMSGPAWGLNKRQMFHLL